MGDDDVRDLALARLVDVAPLRDALKLKLLWIRGVEVTQGMQYYRAEEHLPDANDRGPDNSVRIVAQKPAWVRVYVRSAFAAKPSVGGALRVFKRSHGFLWTQIAELAPQPPGAVTAETSLEYATERADIARTLNFVVPAEQMCGRLRLDVEIVAGDLSDTRSVHVDATLRQTLRMRIVPVSYDGTDAMGNPLTLAAPTLADAQTSAAWSLLVYPVRSTPDITLTSAVQLTFPLTGSPASPGGCASSWLNLNVLVEQAKIADGNQPNTFYYGLVPSAVPIGANSGCASSNVTSGRVGGGATMAHEFGHALGYPHSPCGNVGAGDPQFPAFEPYDAGGVAGASIGEYGLDISTGAVKSPATVRDYMSYCTPRWISLFNYQRAVNHPTLSPSTVCNDQPWFVWEEILVDPWWWIRRPSPEPDPPPWYDEVVKRIDPRERAISIIGVRDVSARVEVRSITRALAVPEVEGGRATDLVAELLDEKGQPIAAGAVTRLVARGDRDCGCGRDDDERGPYVFEAFVPDVERGAALRLVEGGKEVWRYEAPRTEATPPSFGATVSKKGELTVRWRAARAEREPEVWIRWRAADGGEPQVLFVGSGSGRQRVDTHMLPSGEITLDAVAHDGFSRAVSEPVRVALPQRPPTVAILHPYDRRTLEARRTLRLNGIATEPGGRPVDPKRCVWRIDRKEVARGLDEFVTTPEAGEHIVTLMVEGDGGRAEARARITVVDPERDAVEKPEP